MPVRWVNFFFFNVVSLQSKTALLLLKMTEGQNYSKVKGSQEYKIRCPVLPCSSVIQSAKSHCYKRACGSKQDTVDEHKNRGGGHIEAKHNQMADIPTDRKWQCFGACMNYWWGAHGVLGSGVVFTKVNQPWVMSSSGTAAHLRMIKLPPHQLQTINL